jgi:PAS domain S-box-containing protein
MESTSGSERLDGHDPRPRERSPWLLIVGFAVLAVLIAAAGYWAWRQQSASMQSRAERSLVAVGALKADQITLWMEEREADAEVLRGDPLLSAAVADMLAGRDAGNATTSVQTHLDTFQRNYDYAGVVLTSPKGAVLLRSPGTASDALSAETKALVAKATATGRVQSSDIYRDADGNALLDLVAPISAADGGVIATVVLRSDLDSVLYPLVQHWPLPSESGETLLVERRGDQVVYLNELRHRKNTAFELTTPLSKTEVPAVMAVRGRRGIVRGTDYRNAPVLAALQPVPGTPWFIVAKEDTNEVLGAIRTRGWLTAGFALVLVAIAGLGTLLLWRRRESQASAEIRESEARLKEAQSIARLGRWELDLVHDRLHWSDGIFRIFEIDPARFGASYEAFLDTIHPDDRETVDRAYSTSLEIKQPYEVTHRLLMKDGRVKWVHETCRTDVDAGGRPLRSVGIVQDVTARMLSDEALRQSEMELRTLLENLPAGVVVHAPDTTILLSNPLASELLGLTADQLLGKTAIDPEWHFLREDGRALPLEDYPVNQVLSSGRALSGLVVGVRRPASGEPVWLLCNAYPVRDAGGELLQFVVAFTDITDRKQAAEALAASEEKHRALFETMSEGVVYEDADGTITSANPAAERLLGLSLDQMQGRTSLDPRWKAVHDDGSPWPGETHPMPVALKTGNPTVGQVQGIYNPRSGEYVWLSVSAIPEFLAGETRPFRAYAVFHDITEQRRAAVELREREERLRFLIDQTPTINWTVDRDLRFTLSRGAGLQALGLGPDKVLGAYVGDFFGGSGPEADLGVAMHLRALAGESFTYEQPIGDLVFEIILGALRNAHDEIVGVIGVAYDATARKQADVARREAERKLSELNAELELRIAERTAELHAANQELEAFAYTVSHDLRAPLRHISGFSSLLTRRTGDSLDEKSRHYVDTISNSVRDMGVLIDDLLQFSRTGRAELKLEPVDTQATLAEALTRLQQDTEDRAIEWSIGPLPNVVGDHALLRQVWANLLGNAVKYTRGRTPARIEVGARTADGEVVFFVRDNGVGFDMQHAHKLFGVFQRLHSATEFEGTGVGLANVQRIVSRLGGRAWAEAEVDRGATFFFSLPQQKEPR